MSNKLFIAMPVKYTGINLLNTIVNKLKEKGCSWDYELHVLFNGASKESFYYKQFKSLDSLIKLHYKLQFTNIFDARMSLIEEFIKSKCSHIWMIDPDDIFFFDKIPALSEAPSADINKYGCPINTEIIQKDEYDLTYRLRNFSIYHLWNTIFSKNAILQSYNDFKKVLKFNVNYSEDYLINMICVNQDVTIQFHKDIFAKPVYYNNSYSNYSYKSDFKTLYNEHLNLFEALESVKVFKSEFEREFHFNKKMAELGLHCYRQSLLKVPNTVRIFKDIRIFN